MKLELQLLWRRLKRSMICEFRRHRFEGRWYGWRWVPAGATAQEHFRYLPIWLRTCTRCDHAEIAFWVEHADHAPQLELIGFEGPAWETPPLFPPNGPPPEPEVSIGAYR